MYISTWNFFEVYKLHLPYRLVQFCCLLKIYKCLLTPNCTQSHSVTYPNSINLCFVFRGGGKVLCFLTLCNNLKQICFLWYLSAVQFIVCSLNLSSVLLSQCDNKEHFIERIKEMDLEVQRSLVEHIQQVGYMSVFYGWFSDVQCINVIGMQVLYSSAGSRFIPLPGYHLACYINFNFGIFNKTSKGTDVLQSTWCHCQGNQGKYRSNHNIIQLLLLLWSCYEIPELHFGMLLLVLIPSQVPCDAFFLYHHYHWLLPSMSSLLTLTLVSWQH